MIDYYWYSTRWQYVLHKGVLFEYIFTLFWTDVLVQYPIYFRIENKCSKLSDIKLCDSIQ